jgi:hypothetical protein
MAKEWADGCGDESTKEDADTLLAAVELLAQVTRDLERPGVG